MLPSLPWSGVSATCGCGEVTSTRSPLCPGQASAAPQHSPRGVCELGLHHRLLLPTYFPHLSSQSPEDLFYMPDGKMSLHLGTGARRTSISSSSFDTSPLASFVLRTIPAKSLSDFSSLGTFQNLKVIEKLALCRACCHLLLASNLRSI